MNTLDHALRQYGLREIRRACEDQPFDCFSDTPFLNWRMLEAVIRQAHPDKPWLRNVIFCTFGEDGDGPGELYLHEACLPFETAPCAEELAAALHAEARRRDLAEDGGTILVYDTVTAELADLADYTVPAAAVAAQPVPPLHTLPAPRTDFGFSRDGEYLRTAAVLMARTGEGIAPRRRRRATA